MLLLASQILHCWLKTSSFYSSKYSLPSSWQHPLEQVKVWPINILPGGMRTSPDPNRDKYKLLQKSLFPGKSKKLLSTTPAYSVLKRFLVFLCLNLHLFFTQIVWFLCRNLPVQEKRRIWQNWLQEYTDAAAVFNRNCFRSQSTPPCNSQFKC